MTYFQVMDLIHKKVYDWSAQHHGRRPNVVEVFVNEEQFYEIKRDINYNNSNYVCGPCDVDYESINGYK